MRRFRPGANRFRCALAGGCRRHRTFVSTAAALLLFGSLGLVVFAAVLAGKNHELDRERKTAVEERTRAVDVLGFFQQNVLIAALPKEEGGLGINVTLRKAIDAAEPRIAKSFAEQPLLEASVRNTLGETYYVLGERAKALSQFERAFVLRRQVLGPDNNETLESADNLAHLLLDVGRFDEGIAMLADTLTRHQARLGPNHPDTLTSMHNLAYAYRDAGRLDDAIRLYEETLKQRKAILGPEHGDTLFTAGNLASTYREAGRFSEAINLFNETLGLRKGKLAPDHREMLMLMNNIAQCYLEIGCYTDALSLHKATFERQRVALGADHPDTLMSLNNLGIVYQAQARLKDALPLFEEALKRKARETWRR